MPEGVEEFQHIEPDSHTFTRLVQRGHIRTSRGEVQAIAMVTRAVKPGLLFGYFLYGDRAANSLVHRVPDPISGRYRFKLGKARIQRLGESPYKTDPNWMSFKPRDHAPQRNPNPVPQ